MWGRAPPIILKGGVWPPPHSFFSIIIADRGVVENVQKPSYCRIFAWIEGWIELGSAWIQICGCAKITILSNICLDRCLDRAWIGDPVCAKTMLGVTFLLGSGLDRRPCVCQNHGRCHTFAWIGFGSATLCVQIPL